MRLHLSTAVLLSVGAALILGIAVLYARAPIGIPEEYLQNPNAVRNVVERVNGVRFVRILVILPIVIVLLSLIGAICEYLIRRREARKR